MYMPTGQQLLIGGFGVVVILAALRLFSAPIRWVFRLIINTVLGFAGLLIFNLLCQWLGLHLALSLNLVNAASTQKTLGIMLLFAAIGVPLVLVYTATIYRIFRGKVKLGPMSY